VIIALPHMAACSAALHHSPFYDLSSNLVIAIIKDDEK
jgi:hypothetical protein